MFNMIWNFAKSKAISVFSKVDIKDIIKKSKEGLVKQDLKSKPIIKNNEKKKREPKWQSCFPFTFFMGNGRFQPIYFWVTVFSFLCAYMLFVKNYAAWIAVKKGTFTVDMISTADLGVVLGFISSLILLYNSNKKNYKIEDIDKKETDNQE